MKNRNRMDALRKTSLYLLRNEPLLLFFLSFLFILSLIFPQYIPQYGEFVEWHTIIALTGLLMVTVGIEKSGYLSNIAHSLIFRMKNERYFALFTVLFAAFLSMFLTNDIALFVIVPLTVRMLNTMKNDLYRIVVFEAMAVNVGSLLTPIGNPQNLFLWHISHMSFLNFMILMFPIFLVLLLLLILFTFIFFPSRKIEMKSFSEDASQNKAMFFLSSTLLVVYIIALNFASTLLLLILLGIFAIIFHKFIKDVDYPLLILFIAVFIDFGAISQIPELVNLFEVLNQNSPENIFLLSVLFSQIMSNVPATVFMVKFTSYIKAVAYGVNVGGNGVIIASMANVIAMRMIRKRKIMLMFHKYSLIFLLLSSALTYLLFFACR